MAVSECLALAWSFGMQKSTFVIQMSYIITSFEVFLLQNVLITVYEFCSGVDRLFNNIEDMTGQRPSVFFKLCWKYIIPLLSLVSQKDFKFSYSSSVALNTN